MSNYSLLFKFIVMGDTGKLSKLTEKGVGKSCLVLQFIENKIRTHHEITIGVEFGSKMVTLDQK
jgi:Ras-related protein Rab-2A